MKKLLPKLFNPAGFTLVELLVVIAIIAVLATIGFAVYGNLGAQAKARNNVRRSDLDSISKALEINKDASAYIPLATTQFSNGVLPNDPTSGKEYCANSAADDQPADPGVWTTTCAVGPGASWGTVNSTNPPAGTKWKVCASLEAEGATVAKVVCKLSAQ